MAANCRFAFAVHILAVLAYKGAEGVNSALLAGSVNTNAVVIRRVLSDLRRAGLVVTHRGAGGGARLARRPEEITLEEVYHAVEPGRGFGQHPQAPNPGCPVGKGISDALEEVFSEAQTALEAALARRTLASVVETMTEAEASAGLPAVALN